jgi:AraC family transcriptional activator of mtrCDE
VVRGSAVLEDPSGKVHRRLKTGDILLIPHGSAHVLHDGSGKRPAPARKHAKINLTISENSGKGERLDMLCGHFVLAPQHDRILRDYLPSELVVNAADDGASAEQPGTGPQLAGLVTLMRSEAAAERLGGRAMLNALSTAMFALTLRLASEFDDAPTGLLSLAGYPRLAPALAALFEQADRAWTLPELANLCNMSRATFARHFQESLGRSASDLLTDIRMTSAANKLKTSSASTAAVAEEVGYHSEAAFQRAFKQRMGVTPAQWRRKAQTEQL